MDIAQLKEHIVENDYVESILHEIQCHHIIYHSSGYWSCANKDGDNKSAIIIRNNNSLRCDNYTRNLGVSNRVPDLIDLVSYNEMLTFPESIQFICKVVGIDYYYDFNENVPESLLITKMIFEMSKNIETYSEKPLKKISDEILTYYKPLVNDLFYKDGIDYSTQMEFNIGYDEFTNRITIPIYSEINDLVGVKGRLFKEELSGDDLKYLYIEPCARSKILYGLNKTFDYIKKEGRVFVVEAEKGVMQSWSYGIRNVVATGGKEISSIQIEMLTRLGVDIVFAFDKDVEKQFITELSNRFIESVPLFAIFDDDNVLDLSKKESPTDDSYKWTYLTKNNIYRVK